ncbi:tRNA (5-methylaminomethyl-2-thiouridine)(34)-methyltransferase MnmD [Colwellia sp. MSW7]|uniref:tRNA (5-methylaminomethyl-2-thiouridine)(34)-methyltransferase MnmD n=1 Tax=Colwellia maritima TaxID=2912588 RepID=A0ABS9X0R1_9GAMM|nr:tRNA (5-methylaminomethyl-2-thiouridine)(34)-methyltransferase MnmD [Colwellia maritima]MCI2283650.1 tRNA (5-methylaminomethyl-2-thiouridine)(34)-methyltransferase MnmD [Colwellia maritima]
MPKKVTHAPKLIFQEDGTPYSSQFNDIYFDSESGYQQSEQVFLCGNNISKRIKKARERFVIGETGFGTGLNFLLTLQAYHAIQQESPNQIVPKLSFISIEKYPLAIEQLQQSLKAFPQLRTFIDLLLAQYPILSNDENTLKEFTFSFFNNQVTLKLIINDAANGLANITSRKQGLVDAWYLDGFSPAKNPEMWSEALFEQIGRLSKPQATIATFTVLWFCKAPYAKNWFSYPEKRLYR